MPANSEYVNEQSLDRLVGEVVTLCEEADSVRGRLWKTDSTPAQYAVITYPQGFEPVVVMAKFYASTVGAVQPGTIFLVAGVYVITAHVEDEE
jgi:hypothetical protein